MANAICAEDVKEAIARYAGPESFNIDPYHQFTSAAFSGRLLSHCTCISMAGKG